MELKAVTNIEEETAGERILGCRYTNFTCAAGAVQDLLLQHPLYHRRPHIAKEDCNGENPDWIMDPKRIIRGKTYDMEDFVEQCTDSFCELGLIDRVSLKKVPTPFLDGSNDRRRYKYDLEKTPTPKTLPRNANGP